MQHILDRSQAPEAAISNDEEELVGTIDDAIETFSLCVAALEEKRPEVAERMRCRREASAPQSVAPGLGQIPVALAQVEAFVRQWSAEVDEVVPKRIDILKERQQTLEKDKARYIDADISPTQDGEYARVISSLRKVEDDMS